jgi:iron(III) transport system permease protein
MTAVIIVVAAFVLYPIYYLLQAAFDVGAPDTRPPTAYGFDNFAAMSGYWEIMLNTLGVTFVATALALIFGFLTAWTLTRTNVPFRRTLEQIMVVPYYVTPLLGALAWSLLGAPESGFVNQLWRSMGGEGALIDMTSAWGIAWVMALFEGSVAFVMIGAVMKSMDPSLEEASQVIGAGRWRTMLRVTLPLVAPGVLGAAIFVFAEMLGSFSAALVLGTPSRFYVITTAIYQMVSQYPPRIPLAAAMGVSLFASHVSHAVSIPPRYVEPQFCNDQRQGFPSARHGRGLAALGAVRGLRVIRPPVGGAARSDAGICIRAAIGRGIPDAGQLHSENYRTALSLNAVRSAMWNSLLLGLLTATIGVALTGLLSWIIQRSKLPGRGVLEYIVMFPQAVPRLVFAFGMMWAWLVFPIPIYGTVWVLLIAYLTVFLPLGVRTISSVLMQLDKSLDECGQVSGASWGYRLRTITVPLLRPGILAAWLLIFVASVRELGASILLMGPDSKVLTPAIVEAFFSSSSELTAAMALIQTVVVGAAMVLFTVITRRASRHGGT